MSKCLNCGSHVTEDFAKVFGDQDDDVFHCINCLGREQGGRELLRHGAGARRDIEDIEITRDIF